MGLLKSCKEQKKSTIYCIHLPKILKIIKSKQQKKPFFRHESFCWILFCSSVSISFMTWSYIAQSLKSWTILNVQQKGLLKNVQDKNITSLLAEKLPNEKRFV